MGRTMKLAALALSATLALSGLALAQRDYDSDRDDGYHGKGDGEARQRGYERGYRDGVDKGRHEGREHDPFDYRTPDGRQATRGYERWMGPVEFYQRGYQDGYRNGFGAGYRETAGGGGDHDRDDRWRNEGWRTGYDPDSASVANRFGYDDGRTAAREDIERGKSYNSKPRGRFGDRLDGYRREFGSKDRYRAEYTAGYRGGYDSVMRRRY